MNSSLTTNDGAVDFPNGIQRNGDARPGCVVCGVMIAENQWFCRIPQSGHGNGSTQLESASILLCSARCALRHFANSRVINNGTHTDDDRYDRALELLLDGKERS